MRCEKMKKTPIIDIRPQQFNKINRKEKKEYSIVRKTRAVGYYRQTIEAFSEQEAIQIARRNPYKDKSETEYYSEPSDVYLDININDVQEV